MNLHEHEFQSDLDFLIHRYYSEHGVLELQSMSLEEKYSIKFLGVNYMEVPKVLYGLKIYKGNEELLSKIKKRYITDDLSGFTIFILESQSKKFIISALNYKVEIIGKG